MQTTLNYMYSASLLQDITPQDNMANLFTTIRQKLKGLIDRMKPRKKVTKNKISAPIVKPCPENTNPVRSSDDSQHVQFLSQPRA
jgi:hypothetical protein